MLDTFFGFVQFVSFVIALVLGPFVVGSRMFAKWLVYLTLCTIFTPLFGILIYVKFFGTSPLPYARLLLYLHC